MLICFVNNVPGLRVCVSVLSVPVETIALSKMGLSTNISLLIFTCIPVSLRNMWSEAIPENELSSIL